ncbi:uncharacterized protein LOC5521543 isoform X2 [Nematostella vectensis]|nr:uncharacterized protein LOC5521543 isoform X2 [Nematostella vectensis]XP_032222497.1 uncharacterized protein LOC5521543 isoform X2 [Nematostella vectensis]
MEAMNMTKVAQALISLQLQYEDHIRQEKVIKDKWKHYNLHQEQLKQQHENKLREIDKRVLVSAITSKDTTPAQDCETCKDEGMTTSTCSLVISAENFSVSSLSSSTELFQTKESGDPQSNLNTQVRELQIQVLSLTQALEDANRENTKLKQTILHIKNVTKEKFDFDFDEENSGQVCMVEQEACHKGEDSSSQTAVGNCGHCTDHEKDHSVHGDDTSPTSDLPLPPLEMPHFSFGDNR